MKGKRILSVLLTLMLVLNIALAIEGKAEAAEEKNTVKAETELGLASGMEKMELTQVFSKNARMTDGIVARTMLTSATSAPAFESVTLNSGYYSIIPITAQNTGWMWLDYKVTGTAGTTSQVTIEVADEENAMIFDNSEGNGDYGSYVNTQGVYRVGDTANNKGPLYIKKGEVYYVIVVNWGDEYQAPVTISVRGKVFTTLERTLAQGTSKWTLASGIDKNGYSSNKTTYFKVKPDRTGVMTVSLREYGYHSSYGSSGTVTLLNSDKKVLSDEVTYNSKYSDSRVYFGVKKGVTYYLKVKSCCGNSAYNYKYGVQYSMTSRTDRAIGTKSNAKTLKRKADATNTLFVASRSSSTDWYKFNVTSKRATQIKINTSSIKSGNITVTVYRGSNKIGTDTIPAYYKGNTYDITYGTTWGKANSGTYYVKVVKDAKASGKYSIRYVK